MKQAEPKTTETVELPDVDAAGNVVGTILVDPAVGRVTEQPLGRPVYIDPEQVAKLANKEAATARASVDDPDGPEAVRQWSGYQTHDVGGFPFHHADVVTVDLEKERARMREEHG